MIETIYQTLANLAAGAFIGASVAMGGYFKNAGEKFDGSQVMYTAILGTAVGGVSGLMGMTYDQGTTYLGNAGAIALIQYIGKGIVRRVYPKLKAWLVSHKFMSNGGA